MGLFDDLKKKLPGLKDKVDDLVEEHDDTIKDGLDKAAEFADDKTGGKHRDKIAKGLDKAKDVVDDMAEPDTPAPRKPRKPAEKRSG
jgi:hypothetical protein